MMAFFLIPLVIAITLGSAFLVMLSFFLVRQGRAALAPAPHLQVEGDLAFRLSGRALGGEDRVACETHRAGSRLTGR